MLMNAKRFILNVLDCGNSGEFSDDECSGWKTVGYCQGGSYAKFMTDHCSMTCGFCSSSMKTML